MFGMLGFIVLFVGFLFMTIMAKTIAQTITLVLYRATFAIYYFVKNEDVNYVKLLVTGEITRPSQNIVKVDFSQGAKIKKSA